MVLWFNVGEKLTFILLITNQLIGCCFCKVCNNLQLKRKLMINATCVEILTLIPDDVVFETT